jgi:hypothetical protein
MPDASVGSQSLVTVNLPSQATLSVNHLWSLSIEFVVYCVSLPLLFVGPARRPMPPRRLRVHCRRCSEPLISAHDGGSRHSGPGHG